MSGPQLKNTEAGDRNHLMAHPLTCPVIDACCVRWEPQFLSTCGLSPWASLGIPVARWLGSKVQHPVKETTKQSWIISKATPGYFPPPHSVYQGNREVFPKFKGRYEDACLSMHKCQSHIEKKAYAVVSVLAQSSLEYTVCHNSPPSNECLTKSYSNSKA